MGKKKKKDDETIEQQAEQNETTVDPQEASATEPQEELSAEEQLRVENAELNDKVLRLIAEFENFKKRSARLQSDMIRSANDRILSELLEVVDNFDRALATNVAEADGDSFRSGIEMIYSQLNNLLTRHEISAIEAVGFQFDPNLHEAMMEVDSDEFDRGVIALEINKGFRQGERVVRHSKVAVSRGSATVVDNGTDAPKSEKE